MKKNKLKDFFISNKFIIIILLLVAILYSIFLFHDTLSPDEAVVLWYSVSTNPYPAERPLLPIIISFFDFFLPNEVAGRIVVFLFSLLGIFFIYLLGKEIKNDLIGFLAAVFLSLNPWYWMMSNRILQDVPLTTITIITCYFLFKYLKYNNKSNLILSLVFLIISFFMKEMAVVLVPFVLFFLLFGVIKNNNLNNWYKKINISFIFLFGISFVIFVILFLGKKFIMKYVFYFLSYSMPSFFLALINNIHDLIELMFGYVPHFLLIVLYLFLFMFLLVLIYSFIKSRDKLFYLFLIFWFLIIFVFRIFFGGDIIRYLLPLLPAMIFLVLLSFSDFISLLIDSKKKYFKYMKINMKKIVIIIIFLFVMFYLIIGFKVGFMSSFNKPGFKEAGTWLSDNVNKDNSIIYASSLKQVRYYSGIDYINNGGSIYSQESYDSVGLPIDVETLIFREPNKSSYLVVDFREKLQANWVYHINVSTSERFSDMDFKLVYVVFKDQPFYIQPPNQDRNEFLSYFNITPYELTSNGSEIYFPGAETYTYNFDDGEFIESIGFERADSLLDYVEFMLTKPTYLKQPVVLIFKREASN